MKLKSILDTGFDLSDQQLNEQLEDLEDSEESSEKVLQKKIIQLILIKIIKFSPHNLMKFQKLKI